MPTTNSTSVSQSTKFIDPHYGKSGEVRVYVHHEHVSLGLHCGGLSVETWMSLSDLKAVRDVCNAVLGRAAADAPGDPVSVAADELDRVHDTPDEEIF